MEEQIFVLMPLGSLPHVKQLFIAPVVEAVWSKWVYLFIALHPTSLWAVLWDGK